MVQCEICQKYIKSLSHHVKVHSLSIKEYYELYCRSENEGYCLVCGKQTKFYGINKGYNKYCSNMCSEQCDIKLNKQKQTCFKKYGVVNPSQSIDIQNKIQQTCLNKYGVKSYSQTEEYLEKYTATCLEKYGKSTYCKTDDFKNKKRKTLLSNYGVDNYSQSFEYSDRKDSINTKRYLTMKKNNSFNVSKPEKKLEDYLRSIFNDVMVQYKSDIYPFNCDFYIPEIDLYIELQISWTHGKEPFIGSDEQLDVLKMWEEKAKTSEYYQHAINVWTKSDVFKRTVAKNSNLNYLEIFDVNYVILPVSL